MSDLFQGTTFNLVDNYDWFKDIKLLDFLRDIGKQYSMTELIQRDFIADRMGKTGSGISFAEFSYTLIQGYDFWQLYKQFGVELQIGGSDQWGNMLSGVPLIRKKENAEVHAMSMPLVINKSTGQKFGKSENGAVWLSAQKTTPTQFYQFWINIEDEYVEDYLKIYTELNQSEIGDVMQAQKADPQKRLAQARLARELSVIVHGETAADFAELVTRYLIGEKPLGEANDEALNEIRHNIPSLKATIGGSIIQALVESGLAGSNSDARRLLNGNAITLNGRKVSRENFETDDFMNGRTLLRRGKAFKDSALVELN